MSSTDPSTRDGAALTRAPPLRYFCHECDRTVTLTPSPTSELACPICNGGFLEEFELPEPNPNPSLSPFFSSSSSPSSSSIDPFSSLFFSPPASRTTFDLNQPTDILSLLGFDTPSRAHHPSPGGGAGSGSEPFNPLQFLASYLQSMSDGGASIQFIVEGGQGLHGAGSGGGATLGDYFVGPGLEQLIQQLVENDPNRYGTPPASKSAVGSLPDVTISGELLNSDEAQCAVCKDTFEVGDQTKQMPCKHLYHKDCILPWLELHNSCPVCRYELPTDDPDYEQQRQTGTAPTQRPQVDQGGGNVSDGGGGATSGERPAGSGETYSPRGRLVERRFRISLPWPFRTASGTEPISDGGNGGGASGSGENAGGSGNTDTIHESLD